MPKKEFSSPSQSDKIFVLFFIFSLLTLHLGQKFFFSPSQDMQQLVVGISVPRPGIEPRPQWGKHQILTLRPQGTPYSVKFNYKDNRVRISW